MSLSLLAVRRPVATTMLFSAVVLLGLTSLNQLAVDLLPDLNYPRLLLRTQLPDAAPEEIVEFITRPIEETMSTISGIKQITSRSREGVSLVSLEFFWRENMDFAALAAREKLDEIRFLLPETVLRSQVIRLDPSARPIMQVAVSGVEMVRLTELSRQIIRRRLEQIRGVALVELVGSLERQIEVQIDPQKLLTQNIQIEQISSALRSNNLSASGGTIKKGRYRFSIRILGEFRSLADIQKVSIASSEQNSPILLGDIARISYISKEQEAFTRLNGNETLGLLITKEAGSNTVQITRIIKERLQQIREEIPELNFTIVSQQAEFIEQSIDNVFFAIILGGILAFFALYVFLHDIRHPFNIGIAIPISIIATFVCMHFSGISLNIISLGGLALGIGMLVDNSIVVLENIFRLREEGDNWVDASGKGAQEVALPLLASTLTTCAVFVPIIYVEGLTGELFRDQSLTVVFSLLASLFVALLLLPVLASRFHGRMKQRNSSPYDLSNTSPDENPRPEVQNPKSAEDQNRIRMATKHVLVTFINDVLKVGQAIGNFYHSKSSPLFLRFDAVFLKIQNSYHRLLLYSLNHKMRVVLLVTAVFGLTLLFALQIDRRMLPKLYPGEVRYHLELPPDATLYQTAEVARTLEENFLSSSYVNQVFSRCGSAESVLQSETQYGTNHALITIKRRPDSEISAENFVAYLRGLLPVNYQYKGEFESGDPAYLEVLGLGGSDLQISVTGLSYTSILPTAQHVQKLLSANPGLNDVQLSYQPGATQYQIRIDRAKAALHGVQTDQIVNTLRANASGIVATQVKEFDRTIDVLVRPGLYDRDSWDDIYQQSLNINGNPVPLREVIQYKKVTSTEEILRQDQQETILISASLGDLPRQTVIDQIQDILMQLQLPEDIRVSISGQQEEFKQSLISFRNALLLSLILVYLILAAQFESLFEPFIILMSVPFGTIGAVWLSLLTGNSINIISGIGYLVLTGIVVNDAIIKVDFINRARNQGKALREAILEASRKRFRPILITTITTILGLLPMAFSGGSGAELRQPLAIVVVGGLLVATFLTLILIPVAYEGINQLKMKKD